MREKRVEERNGEEEGGKKVGKEEKLEGMKKGRIGRKGRERGEKEKEEREKNSRSMLQTGNVCVPSKLHVATKFPR